MAGRRSSIRLHTLPSTSPTWPSGRHRNGADGALKETAGVKFWKGILAAVVAAFPIGFLWTASVGIYLLMRRDIDAAEMDEVAVEDQEKAFGLPNLTSHPTGVPSVDESQSPDYEKEEDNNSSLQSEPNNEG